MEADTTPNVDFEYRKTQIGLILEQLGDDPRREENEDRLVTLLEGGALPWDRKNSTPTEYSESRGVRTSYFLQTFFSKAETVIHDDLSEKDVRSLLGEEKRILDEGIGKPSATDGSKGQWRTYHKNAIKTYRWFLGGWHGVQYEMDAE